MHSYFEREELYHRGNIAKFIGVTFAMIFYAVEIAEASIHTHGGAHPWWDDVEGTSLGRESPYTSPHPFPRPYGRWPRDVRAYKGGGTRVGI